MIDSYLKKAGYSYGPHGSGACGGFSHYWARRKELDQIASWFAVQLDRATQGRSHLRPDRQKRLAALRSRLDALQGEHPLWYSLFIGSDPDGGQHVFTEQEVLTIGKTLGPERLMAMLAKHEPSSDPDLVPRGKPSSRCGFIEVGYHMQRFVLEHAPALLRRADAMRLLELPDAREDGHWPIAAAALRPDLAE